MADMNLTVSLPQTTGDALSDMARAEGRAPGSLVLDTVAEHVAASLEMWARILRGGADLAAGRVVPHEEVIAGLRGIVTATREGRG
jgi:predicted transcriptional regulator